MGAATGFSSETGPQGDGPTAAVRPIEAHGSSGISAPRLAAFSARRLHGRLDGQSPAVGLRKRHQPRTFPSPCRRQSVHSLVLCTQHRGSHENKETRRQGDKGNKGNKGNKQALLLVALVFQ